MDGIDEGPSTCFFIRIYHKPVIGNPKSHRKWHMTQVLGLNFLCSWEVRRLSPRVQLAPGSYFYRPLACELCKATARKGGQWDQSLGGCEGSGQHMTTQLFDSIPMVVIIVFPHFYPSLVQLYPHVCCEAPPKLSPQSLSSCVDCNPPSYGDDGNGSKNANPTWKWSLHGFLTCFCMVFTWFNTKIWRCC